MARMEGSASEAAKTAAYLTRNAVECLPAGGLEERLAAGRPLRVKLGLDPTASDLHLGHIVNAIYVWGIASAWGPALAGPVKKSSVLLRIEDHDRHRSRPEFELSILEDLAWLGFVADPQLVPFVRPRSACVVAATFAITAKGSDVESRRFTL